MKCFVRASQTELPNFVVIVADRYAVRVRGIIDKDERFGNGFGLEDILTIKGIPYRTEKTKADEEMGSSYCYYELSYKQFKRRVKIK